MSDQELLAPGGASSPADSRAGRTEGASTPEAGAETVRDLAQAIISGHAFTDADAILVARAYLDSCGETA